MANSGAIIIIEDDSDDRILLEHIFKDLEIGNKLIWFDSADNVFSFLSETSQNVFIILSNIKLPGKSGLELKYEIDSDHKLRKKSIPFVFYTTSVNQSDVNEAYTKMNIQGFFKKEMEYDEAKRIMRIIFDYWGICKHPNTQ